MLGKVYGNGNGAKPANSLPLAGDGLSVGISTNLGPGRNWRIRRSLKLLRELTNARLFGS